MDLLNIQPNVVSASLSDKIFLIYGEPGTYKTTTAAGFPDSIIAAFEQGYSFIEGAIAQPIRNWVDFRKFTRELQKPAVKERFKTVIIDTVTLMVSMVEKYVLTSMQIDHESKSNFGEAYTRIKREFEESLLSIPQMGYGLVMVAHAEEGEVNNQATAKVNLNKRATAIVNGLADFILYTRKEFRDNSEGRPEDETVYAYSDVASIQTKRRAKYFPRRFEFNFDNLVLALEEAVAKQKEVEGIAYSLSDDKEREVDNKYKKDEIDFEPLKDKTIALATQMLETAVAKDVEEILFDTIPQGFKISTLTTVHADLLEIIYDKLVELQSKVK